MDHVCCRFELEEELAGACTVYAQWLQDSTQITTKELVIAHMAPECHVSTFMEPYLPHLYNLQSL